MVLAVHDDPPATSTMYWPPTGGDFFDRNTNHRFGGQWPPGGKVKWGDSAEPSGAAVSLQKGESKHEKREGGGAKAKGEEAFGGASEEVVAAVQSRAGLIALSRYPTVPVSTEGLERLRETWTVLHAWSAGGV